MNDQLPSYPLSDVPVEQLSYEQAFSELEAIVNALESEDRTLDVAMNLYERGQLLARHCAELLDRAELKVQRLSGDELVDFTPPEGQ